MENPIIIEHAPVEKTALGGALEGAEKNSRETMRWNPSMGSPDRIINSVKPMADARSRDMTDNDGYASGASSIHKDNIVGSQYMLNAKPNYKMLGVDEAWAEEFQQIVEARFNTIGDSESAWLDAARRNTFTGLVRLAVGGFVVSGEVLATSEWMRELNRPFKTAIQMLSPDRLSNPNGVSDDHFLRRGVLRDKYGRPLKAFIRSAHPSDMYTNTEMYKWVEVPFEKPWGRKQVIHIIEQRLPDQSRGISDMVAVLKQMKMTKQFQEITLQNAVVNASYAAAIESELPSGEVFSAIGANQSDPIAGMMQYFGTYMAGLSDYLDGSKNLQIDGVKIPHLFPGTKLHMQPVGTPGGVGSNFEESLLRYTAAGLGLSYEQFSRDYTKTNYSSARASMNETWKFMQSRKKMVADRFATNVYALWLEEDIANGNVPLPKGKTREWFYEPLVKDALTQCAWIGASRGQIDEKKETDAAIARIEGGLSTYEKECARLGEDFREVFKQRSREKKLMETLDVSFGSSAALSASAQAKMLQDQLDKNSNKNSGNDKSATALKLDLNVNHAPIHVSQEPVQVVVSQEPIQVNVSQEPIKVEMSQADMHLHQTLVQPAAQRMKKIPVRDKDGLIVAVREVPDNDDEL